MRPGALHDLVGQATELARGRTSPATRRRARRIASWAYLRQRRLRGARTAGPRSTLGETDVGSADLGQAVLHCLLAANEHGDYCVPVSSRRRPVAQAILGSNVWEPDTLSLISHADPDGDVVHAGTFFGDFLPALAHARCSGALVWAFEPSGENFRCAEVTVKLNALENVVLTHAALGARAANALLQTTDRLGLPLGGASRLLVDPVGDGGRPKEEVAVLALDEAIDADRRVGVLHLDVEGHEQQALIGAKRTIERCLPLIVLETLPDAAWVAEQLSPLGYEYDGAVDRNFILRNRRSVASG
jgi:FkbM family methyltransferase